MRNRRKKFISIIVLLVVLISITIGYSALSSTLNILGTTNISSSSWSVHFGTGSSDIAVTSGSVTTTKPTIVSGSSNLKLSYSITLTNPGDFYEFTAKIVNDGSINAKLSAAPTIAGLSTAQDVYTNYTVTYSDGTAIAANDTLNAGSNKVIKVRVEFDRNVNSNQLPTQNQTLTLTVGLNYVQA